jgi:anthranilate synthase
LRARSARFDLPYRVPAGRALRYLARVTVPSETHPTRGGVRVRRSSKASMPASHRAPGTDLDNPTRFLLTSSYEYPGRYTRWDLGFVDPPLVLMAATASCGARPSTRAVKCCCPISSALRATEGSTHRAGRCARAPSQPSGSRRQSARAAQR